MFFYCCRRSGIDVSTHRYILGCPREDLLFFLVLTFDMTCDFGVG